MALYTCEKCGKRVPEEYEVCPYCKTPNPAPKPKKKKHPIRNAILVVLVLFVIVKIIGSGGDDEPKKDSPGNQSHTQSEQQANTPPDLTGEWKQTNSNSKDTYQALYITENEIEAYWIIEEENTTMLYWAGTFKLPKDGSEPYTFDSINDHDRTSSALLASEDATKMFTYENGKIKYSVSALGATMEVEAEKQAWGYSENNRDAASGSAGRMVGSGDLGDSHVEIKGAVLTRDFDGKPAIMITYAWTNNSDKETSAMMSVKAKAFQDGVEIIDATIISDDYEPSIGLRHVRPGTTIDVQCAYVLSSETSTVEFELSDFTFMSTNNDLVVMDFNLASLQ